MTDMADTSEVVTRTSPHSALRAQLRRKERSRASKGGRAAVWTAVMLIGAATLIPIIRYAQQEMDVWALQQGGRGSINRALTDWINSSSADYVETISESSLDLPKPDAAIAYAAAQRTTTIDSSRAYAWAALAWMEYSKSRTVTPAVLDALSKSMGACPFCRQDLIRWRFNFVLANWAAVPEAMRAKAFEQADLLRWTGNNHVFLAEMSAKAAHAGIPFDSYRMSVKSPVKAIDLGPAPDG